MDLDLGNGNPQSGELNAEFHKLNITPNDVNKTVTASQFIAGFYALLFYLVLLILSVLGVCFRACAKMFSSRATSLLFLIGTMLACVNVLCNSDNLEVRVYFRVPTALLVGIVFALVGAVFFFSKPEEAANQTTLARQQPSMGLVVGAISIPLIIVEIFLLAAASVSRNKSNPESWALVLADKTTFLVQKVVQAIVYILLLRYRTICPRYKENAKFYLKTLAFFNFIEWVDSQVNEDTDIKLSHANLSYSAWFDILIVFYKALIIDYRLLCSLLFLEHSLEEEMADNYDEVNDTPNRNMTLKKEQYRAAGYIFGLLSLSAPICTALYHVENLHIPPWVHVFAIIVNFTIIGCGAAFLCRNDLTSDRERHQESSGVQSMVCFLGAVGLTCWIIKAPISGYWAAIGNGRIESDVSRYFAWAAAKYFARGISTAFLMGLFLKVKVQSLARKNSEMIANHFLVPAMILTIFGAFAESLIDQYVGPVDSRLRKEIDDASLDLLFAAGPPMYLGFLIHMVLHFVIIQAEIVKRG